MTRRNYTSIVGFGRQRLRSSLRSLKSARIDHVEKEASFP